MPRVVTAAQFRAELGNELDALSETADVLYVSKRGRLTAVVLDSEQYVRLVNRLDFLEDSLEALTARDEREASMPWKEVRDPGR